MTINLQSLGAKLAQYREQLAESLEDVTAATGIDSARLAAMEAGATEPTGDEILILADHWKCDYKFFISNERVAPFEQIQTLYRAHGIDFSKADRRAVQEFLYLCDTEAFLMQEMGRSRPAFMLKGTGHFKADGERGAEEFRRFLGLADRDIPTDIYASLRQGGAHVFRRRLGNSNISGLFVKHPAAGHCLLVNHSEDVYRQRFSAGHEMAHSVYDADAGASVSYVRHGGPDLREVRANRFASCLLLPPMALRALPPVRGWTAERALGFAKQFRVSCDALGVAMQAAGLASPEETARIRALRVPRDEKTDPELAYNLTLGQLRRKERLLELGLSDFYVGLCFEALSAGVISAGRLAEALLTSLDGAAEIGTIYGRSLHGTN